MSSDHAPLWITPSHPSEAPFVVAYRLRLCVDAATAVGWAGPRRGVRSEERGVRSEE